MLTPSWELHPYGVCPVSVAGNQMRTCAIHTIGVYTMQGTMRMRRRRDTLPLLIYVCTRMWGERAE